MVEKREGDYAHQLENLKRQVSGQFVNNPALCFIQTEVETVADSTIDFEVRLIRSLAKKPTLEQNKERTIQRKDFNPFLPPFEPGIFISELSQSHRLLFNKFCICKEHTIVVTKEMERQDAPLTKQDFAAMLLAM